MTGNIALKMVRATALIAACYKASRVRVKIESLPLFSGSFPTSTQCTDHGIQGFSDLSTVSHCTWCCVPSLTSSKSQGSGRHPTRCADIRHRRGISSVKALYHSLSTTQILFNCDPQSIKLRGSSCEEANEVRDDGFVLRRFTCERRRWGGRVLPYQHQKARRLD
jgi:hypothetical protein